MTDKQQALLDAAVALVMTEKNAMNHQDIQNAERAVLEAAREYGEEETVEKVVGDKDNDLDFLK